MSNIHNFRHEDFGELTVIDRDGEFFFIGSEVAAHLGYTNPQKAIRDHVENEDKLTERIVRAGQARSLYLINESGLYALVLSSKLEAAKRFKRWVTSAVLPSIRKNGGYLMQQEKMSANDLLAKAVVVAHRIIDEKTQEIEELKPKAQYFDALVDRNLLTNFRNTAKELHIPPTTLIRFLLDRKLLYRDRKQRLLPYERSNKGYFEVKEWFREDGELLGLQTLVTPKGRNYLLVLLGGDASCD